MIQYCTKFNALFGSKTDDYISFYGLRTHGKLCGSSSVVTNQIGVLIEDEDWVESYMNGEPWRAGKFAYSLQISLWLEHLGLNPGEQNAKIYHDVFSCIPNDGIHSRSALKTKCESLERETWPNK